MRGLGFQSPGEQTSDDVQARLSQQKRGLLAQLYRDSGIAKVDSVCNFIATLLGLGETLAGPASTGAPAVKSVGTTPKGRAKAPADDVIDLLSSDDDDVVASDGEVDDGSAAASTNNVSRKRPRVVTEGDDGEDDGVAVRDGEVDGADAEEDGDDDGGTKPTRRGGGSSVGTSAKRGRASAGAKRGKTAKDDGDGEWCNAHGHLRVRVHTLVGFFSRLFSVRASCCRRLADVAFCCVCCFSS